LLLVAVAVAGAATPAFAESGAGSEGPPTSGSGDMAITPRIVNGSPASRTDWPYMAGLLLRAQTDPWRAQFCGGTVVAPTLVVTAAHCVTLGLGDQMPASTLDVLVGADDLATGEGKRIHVSAITVHPGWDPDVDGTGRHDIAIVQLAQPTAHAPAKVIPWGTDWRVNEGRIARVAGWGCSAYQVVPAPGNCNTYPVHLRETALTMTGDAACERFFGTAVDTDTMMCGGKAGAIDPGTGQATGRSPCFGDSGGPLVVEGYDGTDLLAGVVSWGPECGTGPAVFTRVSRYRDWLAAHGVPVASPPFALSPDLGVDFAAFPVVGDFDGDGASDVVWYRPGPASDPIWWGGRNGFVRGGDANVLGTFFPVVGDFDADGRDDVLWFAPGPTPDPLWRGRVRGFARVGHYDVRSGYTPAAGDFNGDGHHDVLWYRPGDAGDVLWRGTAAGFTRGPDVSVGGKFTPIVGDYDRDGIDDVLWYTRSSASYSLATGAADGFDWKSSGPTLSNSFPLPGDFDGDGYTDTLWYRPGYAVDLLRRSGPSGFERSIELQWSGTHTALTGDFNGNGRDDVLWYGRGPASDRVWYGLPR
jgi:secreted trypsin-like serine protease